MARPKKTESERQAEQQVKAELKLKTLYPQIAESKKGNSNASILKALTPGDLDFPEDRLIPKLWHMCKQMECDLGELKTIIERHLNND